LIEELTTSHSAAPASYEMSKKASKLDGVFEKKQGKMGMIFGIGILGASIQQVH
jgi:hypothetical protein